MLAPAAAALPRRPRGIPARYRGVLVAAAAFGAALTALTLLEGPPGDHEDDLAAVERGRDLKVDWHPHLGRRRKNREKKAKKKAKEQEAAARLRAADPDAATAPERSAAAADGETAKKKKVWHPNLARRRKNREKKARKKAEKEEAQLAADPDATSSERSAAATAIAKATAEREAPRAANVTSLEWSDTTTAFLPVLTQQDFGRYVDTFRTVLGCFHENGLYLLPTGGTLVGTLRHRGMIPWDNNLDVYYFYRDRRAIFAERGPVQACLREAGYRTEYYRPAGAGPRGTETNIRFVKWGKHMLSAFPARPTSWWRRDGDIAFVSQSLTANWSPMAHADIFPLVEYPFHDYHVHLPRDLHKYLAADWGRNQLDAFKTPTLDSLMSTVVSGHLHRGCKREMVVADIAEVEFLKYYDPEEPLTSLPFRPVRCSGRVLREYEEYVRMRQHVEMNWRRGEVEGRAR